MRPLKSILLGALLAGCSLLQSGPETPSPTPSALFIASSVIQAMYDIQTHFPVETVRCLRGMFSPEGRIDVLSMTPTWVNEADAWHVNFQACEGADLVGWYHNHPGPEVICFPSEADQSILLQPRVHVIVLTCAEPETLIWMFRGVPQVYRWRGAPPAPDEG